MLLFHPTMATNIEYGTSRKGVFNTSSKIYDKMKKKKKRKKEKLTI